MAAPSDTLMSTILPINVDNLLHRRTVESERVEFKASWDTELDGTPSHQDASAHSRMTSTI